jgi:membrane protease YdiL (CAAX protease family)
MLPRKPWKPERVVWMFVAFMAANLLGVLVVQGYSSALSKEETKAPINVAVMLLGTLMYQGVTLVLVGVLLRLHKVTWSEAFGFTSKRLTRTIGLAILAAAIVLPIALALNWLSTVILEGLGQKASAQQTVQALQSTETREQMIYFGIVTIVLAPIVEELLFRGILYPTVKQFGYPKFALWSVSIFFAAEHLNVPTFIPLLFLGVILIFLYETTENLLAPIITHALFNAANFALLIWNKFHP